MKRTLIVMVAVTVAMVGSVRGESASRKALAEELIKVMKVAENNDMSFEAAKKAIPSQMDQMAKKAGLASLPASIARKAEERLDLLQSELNWSKIKDDTIAIYAELFTESELKAAIAFYKTADGQSFAAKQQELTKRAQELTQKKTAKIMQRVQELGQEINQDIGRAVQQNRAPAFQ